MVHRNYGMPAMSFADGTPGGTRQFGSSLLEAMHESRQRQAAKIMAEYGYLLAAADVGVPAPLMLEVLESRQHSSDEQSLPVGPARFGAIPIAIAVVLIALHAICAVVIVDRALAHAPESIAISGGD